MTIAHLEKYDDLLTVENVAEFFGTNKSTIYREIKRGKFGKTFKIGKRHLIPKKRVLELFFE